MIRRMLRAAALFGVVAMVAGARAGQDVIPDAASLLQRAENAYDRGIAESSNPARAKADFTESAAAYRELAEDRGIRNARLLANLGNAYLLSGDAGRAVLSYRRAARIDPTDISVRAGLDAARSRVGVVVEPSTRNRMLARLGGWRTVVEPGALLVIGGFAWAGGWIGMGAARVWPRAWRIGRGGATAVALGGLCIGIVLFDDTLQRSSTDAVLIADGAIGRNGPGGAVYEPSFDKPLAGGVELNIEEVREDWVRVRLADGRRTWLPRSAVERI